MINENFINSYEVLENSVFNIGKDNNIFLQDKIYKKFTKIMKIMEAKQMKQNQSKEKDDSVYFYIDQIRSIMMM